MKQIASTLLACLAVGTPVIAQDWNGGYIGLAIVGTDAGQSSATADTPVALARPKSVGDFAVAPGDGPGDGPGDPVGGGNSFSLNEKTSGQIMAGYLWQSDNLVYGAELALGSAPISGADPVVSLSARLGVAQGKTLFYSSLGVTRFGGSFDTNGGRESLDFTGPRFAIGMEHMVSQHGALRFELSQSNFKRKDLGATGSLKPRLRQIAVGYTHRF